MRNYRANRVTAKVYSWCFVVLFPTAVLLGTPTGWPRWLFMWLLAFSIFAGCKWLTWQRADIYGAPVWQQLAYLLAWPGMDVRAFLGPPALLLCDRPSFQEWMSAGGKLLLGVLVFWAVPQWVPREHVLVLGWLGMIGLALMLHFGLFHLLSCGWRAVGIEARPLMNGPLASATLSDFWGCRWNTAFRDLTYGYLFRPLARRWGAPMALLTAFAASGLLHDVVISVPAAAGYGGPTCFFLLQAFAMLLERSRVGRALGLGDGWRGRALAALVLVGPVGWLFHPAFVENIVVPFMHALGASGGA